MLLRIRTVKPGFFWDEDLASYPPLCRIFLEGLWCAADKVGRLEDRPMMLQKLILPYEKEEMAGQFLELLSSPGPVRGTTYLNRYDVAGKRYIQLLNFLEDHRPGKFEPPSAIPSPEGFVADVSAYVTAVDGRLRREVYLRDNHQCVYCGADLAGEPRKICIDFVIPLTQGGAGSRKNLVTSCKKCHGRKAERTPDEAGMTWPEGFGEKLAERPVQALLPLDGGAKGVIDPVPTPSDGGHDTVNPPLKGGHHPVDHTSSPRQHDVDTPSTSREQSVNDTLADVNHPLTGQQPPVNGGQQGVNPPFTPLQPPVDTPLTTVHPPSEGSEQPDNDPLARKGMESHGKEGKVDIVRPQPPLQRVGADVVLGDFGESPEPGSGRPISSDVETKEEKGAAGQIIPFTASNGNGGNGNREEAPLPRRLVVGMAVRSEPKRIGRFFKPTEESDEIIAYLNKKLGSNYALNGQKTLHCIHEWIEQGKNVEQFKRVIDRKAAQWKKDPKFSVYLRPQTLFGENFEAYCNEVDGRQEQMIDQLVAVCQNRLVTTPSWRRTQESFTKEQMDQAAKEYIEEVKTAKGAKDIVTLERLSQEDILDRMRKTKEAGNAG